MASDMRVLSRCSRSKVGEQDAFLYVVPARGFFVVVRVFKLHHG